MYNATRFSNVHERHLSNAGCRAETAASSLAAPIDVARNALQQRSAEAANRRRSGNLPTRLSEYSSSVSLDRRTLPARSGVRAAARSRENKSKTTRSAFRPPRLRRNNSSDRYPVKFRGPVASCSAEIVPFRAPSCQRTAARLDAAMMKNYG